MTSSVIFIFSPIQSGCFVFSRCVCSRVDPRNASYSSLYFRIARLLKSRTEKIVLILTTFPKMAYATVSPWRSVYTSLAAGFAQGGELVSQTAKAVGLPYKISLVLRVWKKITLF